jgi:hypothetical protein
MNNENQFAIANILPGQLNALVKNIARFFLTQEIHSVA